MIELAATIERRLLINYRVDPAVVANLLPAGLRPQLIDGSAVAGICLLRLGALRPAWLRPAIGWGAENAAHRIAVMWDDDAGAHTGVYIPERHTASIFPVLFGGRLMPGVHRRAKFETNETASRFSVGMTSRSTQVHADVDVADQWSSSLFATIDDASRFFQNGATGWSPTRDGSSLEGLTLQTTKWAVQPGAARSIQSTYFEALPSGSAQLDSVLVMRNVPITWTVPSTPAPHMAAITNSR